MKLKWQREYDAHGKLIAWTAQHRKYIIRVYREYQGWAAIWTLTIDDYTTPPEEHMVMFTGFAKASLAKEAAPEQLRYLKK